MKQIKNILFPALAFAILVGALAPRLSDARGFGFAFGLANRVAGSYLAVAEFTDLPVPVQFLLTVNRDKTVQVSTSNDFGSGANLGFSSPSYGAWERIDFLEISGTLFGLVFDNTGLLVQISQANFRQRCIDQHCNMIEGDLSIAFFLCNAVCPNPQDELPLVPIFQTSGTFSAQRIMSGGIDADNAENGSPEE